MNYTYLETLNYIVNKYFVSPTTQFDELSVR